MHPQGRRRARRRSHAWLACLFALMLTGAALVSQRPADGQPPPAGQPAPAAAAPLDKPLKWLYEARQSYAGVKDYTCTMISRENVRGKLGEDNIIALKMRTQPFSVNMRWLAPRKVQNQEVCFVLGKNNNMMRVHSTGLKGAVGWQSISPNDPRVMEHSRHTIYEAGIGNLIEQTIKHWEQERKVGKTEVKIAEYKYNNRNCYRIECVRADRNAGSYCYRSVMYIDKDSKIPVRTENYDWPRAGGAADGDLIEMFSYADLRFNVGLTDQEFNR